MRWRILRPFLLPLLAVGIALGEPAMIVAGIGEAAPAAQHHAHHHGTHHSHSLADCCEWCAACCTTSTILPELPALPAAVIITRAATRPAEAPATRPVSASHLLPFAQGPPSLLA